MYLFFANYTCALSFRIILLGKTSIHFFMINNPFHVVVSNNAPFLLTFFRVANNLIAANSNLALILEHPLYLKIKNRRRWGSFQIIKGDISREKDFYFYVSFRTANFPPCISISQVCKKGIKLEAKCKKSRIYAFDVSTVVVHSVARHKRSLMVSRKRTYLYAASF